MEKTIVRSDKRVRPQELQLYFALIENRSLLTSKNSGSQFNRSIVAAIIPVNRAAAN
jgi:hypothetical protein